MSIDRRLRNFPGFTCLQTLKCQNFVSEIRNIEKHSTKITRNKICNVLR